MNYMTWEEQAEIIKALEKENQALREKIAELERRLGLNSETSSQPPSTDGWKKQQRTKSLRTRSGKKSGGQKGHKGYTLEAVSEPDKIIEYEGLGCCEECGSNLSSGKIIKVLKRQVFEIPEPKIEVTEHRVLVKECPKCQKKIEGKFPKGVKAPVQYGERVKAVVGYLYNQQLIPEERLRELLKEVLAVKISEKTIENINKELGEKATAIVEDLKEKLLKEAVKNVDETGLRIKGKNNWLHVVCNEKSTWYRVSEKRKDIEPLLGVKGIVIHDHWKPYYQLAEVEHGLCNAHHLRELKALQEIEQESWAGAMSKLLLLANKYKHRDGSSIETAIKERLRQLYDAIINRGLIFHELLPPLIQKSHRGRIKRRVGHNLLLRLRDYAEDVWRFLREPAVPFTNNQAERDLRMMKCKQKISGGFRVRESAENFAKIRSVISTAKKQGHNILDILTQILRGEIPTFS
jgi:transposase